MNICYSLSVQSLNPTGQGNLASSTTSVESQMEPVSVSCLLIGWPATTHLPQFFWLGEAHGCTTHFPHLFWLWEAHGCGGRRSGSACSVHMAYGSSRSRDISLSGSDLLLLMASYSPEGIWGRQAVCHVPLKMVSHSSLAFQTIVFISWCLPYFYDMRL